MQPKSPGHITNEGLSPLLIAGMMIKPLPVKPLNKLLQHITRHIQNNHPTILARLTPLAGTNFLICPTDLPHDMRLIIGDGHVECMIEDAFMQPVDVRISGPFSCLMDMMDGRIDGDALFFSRSLAIEGNTEALLTLRNAMDSDDIDLKKEILDSLGPLSHPIEALLKLGDGLSHNLSCNMSLISRAITRPLSRRCDSLEQENQGLAEKIIALEKMLIKTQGRVQSLTRKIKT